MSGSDPASRANPSQEYVTNWSAVYGIVATVAILLLGGGLWCWDITQRTDSVPRVKAPDQEVHAAVAPKEHVRKNATFRRNAASAAPPKVDLEEIAADGRHAQRALKHLRVAIWQSVAAANPPIDIVDFVERMEVQTETTLKNPANVISPVSASGYYNYPQTEANALANYLREQVPELDIKKDTKHFVKLANDAKRLQEEQHAAVDQHAHANLLAAHVQQRHNLQGLPLMMGEDCRSDRELAVARNKVAFGVRNSLRRLDVFASKSSYGSEFSISEEEVRKQFTDRLFALTYDSDSKSNVGKYVAIYEQILQVESTPKRMLMVGLLSDIKGREAGEALARRALFDMDEGVRSAAATVLKGRDKGDYQSILQQALNYPWSPVALRAKALYESAESKQNVKQLPEQSDDMRFVTVGHHVSAPFESPHGEWKVKELVKVNHLRNCVMCHQVSCNKDDPLRGQIPSPGQELPRIYYNSSRGDFVRADTVYLRQDFSVMLPVKDHGKWPEMQRFDFFVRTRDATGEDFHRLYQQRVYDSTLPLRFTLQMIRTGFEWLETHGKQVPQLFARDPNGIVPPADS